MKRVLAVALFATLLTGCAPREDAIEKDSTASEVTTIASSENVSVEKTTTETTTTTQEPTTSTTTTPESTTTTTTTTTEAEYGSRKNPITQENGLTLTGTFDGNPVKISILVGKDVEAGKSVEDWLKEENKFNDPVPSSQKLVKATMFFDIAQWQPSNDDPFEISFYDLDFYDEKYTKIDVPSYSYEDKLGGETYEGGSILGIVAFNVPKDHKVAYIKFQDMWFEVKIPN